MSLEKSESSLKRYLQTTQITGKFFIQLFAEKIGLPLEEKHIAQSLTQGLGQMKGPLMKIGQILATVPGLLPETYAETLMTLQNAAPPMGPLFVKRRMRGELGEQWHSYFHAFDENPVFAASLGQIHKAATTNGQDVACKLQYPNMAQVVQTDLKQLRFFCQLYERYGKALVTDDLQEEIANHLYEELDYKKEAQHIFWFQEILRNVPGLQLPTPLPTLSTTRLLTMTWCQGTSFKTCLTWPESLRQKIAERLFTGWWLPFCQAGLLHGDPHLGNYTVNVAQDHTLNILDFGCIRCFPPEVVTGVFDLLTALTHHKTSLLEEAYYKIGFTELTLPLIEALTQWARFLYEPLLEDRERPIDTDFSSEKGKYVAGDVHKALRQHGGIRPPRTFVLLDRAAVGIGSALIRLKASHNWHRLFQDLQDNRTAEQIHARQQEVRLAHISDISQA